MNTKSVIYILIVVVIVIGAFFFFGSSQKASAPNQETQSTQTTATSTAATTVTVSIVNFSFSPNPLTINKGDTVVWANNDSAPHQIAGEGGLSGPVINKGQTYSFTFNTAGTFNYHCAIHPSMKGIVVAQ